MLHNNTYLVFAIRFLKTETLQFMSEERTTSFTTPLCMHHHWPTNFCQCFLCYGSTCCGNTLFHVFHCCWNLLVQHIFHMSPEKKSKGVRSGDRAGNLWIGLSGSIHRFGSCWFSAFLATIALWAGHPSCWYHISWRKFSGRSSISTGKVHSRIVCIFAHSVSHQ